MSDKPIISASLPEVLKSVPCRVEFDAPLTRSTVSTLPAALQIALPSLGGKRSELLLTATEGPFVHEGLTLFSDGNWLAGFGVTPAHDDLEAGARGLYQNIFSAIGDKWHLYRIWNYVPKINEVENGLENYRRFCRARANVFEDHWGPNYHRALPAASAVGSPEGPLAIAFIAGKVAPAHIENPHQVPAYLYPCQYGPRAPSFSRATSVECADRKVLFISGTSAITGHSSVGAGDLDAQLGCTIENLNVVGKAAGVDLLGSTHKGAVIGRSFKVYIRNRDHSQHIKSAIEASLLGPGDEVCYLLADICRSELLLEIEGTLVAYR